MVIIKEPEMEITGPEKTKLPLRFMAVKEECKRQYDIFVLMDQAPW